MFSNKKRISERPSLGEGRRIDKYYQRPFLGAVLSRSSKVRNEDQPAFNSENQSL